MAGMVKMKDLHNLIDLFEEASGKTRGTLSMSIVAYSHGGFGVTLMALDVRHDEESADLLLYKNFDIDCSWSEEPDDENTTKYRECRDYLIHIIEAVKDNE